MRHLRIIIKSILIVVSLLETRGVAKADNLWASVSRQPIASHALSSPKPHQGISASRAAIAHGTFFLVQTTCVGTPDIFNTALYVKQSGRKFSVQDSNGMRLTGRGKQRGFAVKGRSLDLRRGLTTSHVISAGPVFSDYTANFRYTATIRRVMDGSSCQAVFQGNLRIN